MLLDDSGDSCCNSAERESENKIHNTVMNSHETDRKIHLSRKSRQERPSEVPRRRSYLRRRVRASGPIRSESATWVSALSQKASLTYQERGSRC